MGEQPLSVVIAALINKNKILLIQRVKGDYIGYLGLPGGKIEKNEHVSEAAIREIFEETNIKSEFKSHLGFVSEHLIEDGKVIQHFLLHICELSPKSVKTIENKEGKSGWFDMENLEEIKSQIIPSDFLMIEKVIKNKEKNYFNCIIERQGSNLILKKFE